MKTLKPCLWGALAMLLLTSAANAVTLYWKDYQGAPLDFLYESYPDDGRRGGDTRYSGAFNLLNDGYDPSKHVIEGAKVWFAFADDEPGADVGEWVDIMVGDETLWDDEEVDGSHRDGYDYLYMNISGYASLLSALADGIIGYEVVLQDLIEYENGDYQWKREDVWLKKAKLKAWGYEVVPDSGASLGLLGFGLLGLVYVARRAGRS